MNNELITVPGSYIRSVDELLNLQQRYFAAAAKAKSTKLGSDYQESRDILRECKELESKVRAKTSAYMVQIYGAMTAQDAIEQMKKNLDGKGVKNA